MSNIMIITLLKALGLNFPVISDMGYYFSRVIMLVVAEGQTRYVMRLLSSYGCAKMDEFSKTRDIRQKFLDVHSAFVIFPYTCSSQSEKMLNVVSSLLKAGEIDTEPIQALPIFITEDEYIYDKENRLFLVYCDDDFTGMNIPLRTVVPQEKDLSLIGEKIRTNTTREQSIEERTLCAAACFLYPILLEMREENLFEELLELPERLCELDEDVRETDNVGEYFRKSLENWGKKKKFDEVFRLNEEKVDLKKGTMILYDDEYLYMTEALFREIVEPILKIIPIRIMKASLKEQEILLTNNHSSRGYTVKISLKIAGEEKLIRIRMMKFNRESLHKEGELEFIDTCLRRKVGNQHE